MRLALLVVLLSLAGCAAKPAAVARALPPDIIRVPVPTYVAIPSSMTARCNWRADAPPAEVFTVAAGRKSCLTQYEKQLGAIERVQGGVAPR